MEKVCIYLKRPLWTRDVDVYHRIGDIQLHTRYVAFCLLLGTVRDSDVINGELLHRLDWVICIGEI